jgi:hypothetical protein
MSAANGQTVAITANREYGEVGIGELHPLRNGQCAAVGRVEAVRVTEKGIPSRTPDSRNHHHLMTRDSKLPDTTGQAMMNAKVPASGTPCGQRAGPRLKGLGILYVLNLFRKSFTGSLHATPA